MKELKYFWYQQKDTGFVPYGTIGFKTENKAVEWADEITKLYKEKEWSTLLHFNAPFYNPPENLILIQKFVDVKEPDKVSCKNDDLWERMLGKHCILVGVRDLPNVKERYEDILENRHHYNEAHKEILNNLLELLSHKLIISSSGKLSLTSKGEDFMNMCVQVAQFRIDGVLQVGDNVWQF